MCDNLDKKTYSDASSVDSLSNELLTGGGCWIELIDSSDLVVEEWFSSWVKLIQLLVQRQARSPILVYSVTYYLMIPLQSKCFLFLSNSVESCIKEKGGVEKNC